MPIGFQEKRSFKPVLATDKIQLLHLITFKASNELCCSRFCNYLLIDLFRRLDTIL